MRRSGTAATQAFAQAKQLANLPVPYTLPLKAKVTLSGGSTEKLGKEKKRCLMSPNPIAQLKVWANGKQGTK